MQKKTKKISKVLIANRGEIARRIRQTLEELGIHSVQICAPVDTQALFAREAQELYIIEKTRPVDSYLSIPEIVNAAIETGCDAVHPGYGFLSENPEFSESLRKAGIIFIGPSPEAMRLLGSKTAARNLAIKLKVPVAKGSPAGLSPEGLSKDQLLIEAKKIGFPLLIKAAAGGGGKGMRVVQKLEDLAAQLDLASSEALKFFKNPAVFLEKLIEKPRHVEVQILGDALGNVIHLGTRDCSMQRRHQKLLEEAPAPGLSAKLSKGLCDAACKLARVARYQGLGTCEFLVSGEQFYFLEVNTRLQVEHPVTEMITGLDLVAQQIRAAEGYSVPSQAKITFKGHAFEFRVNAEDPFNAFYPDQGRITKIKRAYGNYREDFGFGEGDEISPFFDSMIGKIIVWEEDRSKAAAKTRDILASYQIEGIKSSLDLGPWLLENGVSKVSSIEIGFVERELNSEVIRELQARRYKQQVHFNQNASKQETIEGITMKSEYKYHSDKFKVEYTIEVEHGRDGNFLAIPLVNGKRASNKYCRRSNGLNFAIRSLIEDVLEKSSPAEMTAAAPC